MGENCVNPNRVVFDFTFDVEDAKEFAEWQKAIRSYQRIRSNARKGGEIKLIIRDGRLKFSEMTVSTDSLDLE